MFAILLAEDYKTKEQITIKGNFYNPEEELTFEIEGEWTKDPRYGKQFKVEHSIPRIPLNTKGIREYLANSKIKGLGPALADKIVQHFKEEIIKIIEEDKIERFREVPGIGPKKAESIKNAWEEQKEFRQATISLQGYGISINICQKIFKKYGTDSITRVKNNPYLLAQEVFGIGFIKADEIAYKIGIRAENENRIKNGILYTLHVAASENGHLFLPKSTLIEQTFNMLTRGENYKASTESIENGIQKLKQELKIQEEDGAIYAKHFYIAEKETAKKLIMISQSNKNSFPKDSVKISKLEEKFGIKYDKLQQNSIETALSAKIMVITGGPGTGKTTVIKGIIESLKEKNCKILLAAPTGRAAKRMKEATGMQASTIHKLLGVSDKEFFHNEENPLEEDVLILDECSMIDASLFHSLIKAIPYHMKLIMVGDIDQLPAVGPGNILRDIINSEKFPVIKLNTVHRQALESSIVANAHRINNGKMPVLENTNDFFFIEQNDGQEIQDLIVKICKKCKENDEEFQVLSPMKKRSGIGVEELNTRLQAEINPDAEELKFGNRIFKKNDKIMQIKNNYGKRVYNGDIGRVYSLNPAEKKIFVKFEDLDTIVEYEGSEIGELVLAYACTIHKSQGSEYKNVIMPLTYSFFIMLQRNLLYTGLTRAKRRFYLIGEKKAISTAVRNAPITKRNTRLSKRLKEF